MCGEFACEKVYHDILLSTAEGTRPEITYIFYV